MDIPAAGAWPWLVLGAVLGIILLALIGLGTALLLRPPAGRAAQAEADAPRNGVQDDLPGFLESPPGSAAGPVARPDGWPALSALPARTTEREPAGWSRSRRQTVGALVAMTTAALLLIGVAAAVAATRSSRPAPAAGEATPDATVVPEESTAPTPGRSGAGDLADDSVPLSGDGAAAELAFAGVVLERRAVGVTAAYPSLTLTWDGDRALAHLELPTFNCLSADAPEDPAAAGCTRSVTEYADLPSPALTVHRMGNRLRISGPFATYLRPNGTPPVWTGRVYEVAVTVGPESATSGRGWQPAEATVRLGDERAATADVRTGRIRFGD